MPADSKILSMFDTAEETEIFAVCRHREAQLKHDFRVDTAVCNLRKAMQFWLWCSLLVDGVRCAVSEVALRRTTGAVPMRAGIFIGLYWAIFGLTVLCIVLGFFLQRNAQRHYRLILFGCDAYMLLYMLRGVAFALLDLQSGIIGFSLIVVLFISGYTLYFRPMVILLRTGLVMGVFFVCVGCFRLQAFLEPLVLFRLTAVALLSALIGIARYRAKYKAFLKERLLVEKSEELNRLNSRLEENRLYIEQQNQKLQALTDTDALTGLGSRHRLLTDAAELLQRCAKKDCFVTAAIADVDDFKRVNDTFGHTVGDACLRAIGTVFQSIASEQVRPYRLGGDELIVLFEGKSRSEAFLTMNRVLSAVSNLKIPKCDIPITLSVGIYSAVPTPDSHIDTYIEKTDARMYAAKANGRNQIVTILNDKGEPSYVSD